MAMKQYIHFSHARVAEQSSDLVCLRPVQLKEIIARPSEFICAIISPAGMHDSCVTFVVTAHFRRRLDRWPLDKKKLVPIWMLDSATTIVSRIKRNASFCT